MSAIIPLYHLLGIDYQALTKMEKMLLEAILFNQIYRQLQQSYQSQYDAYFHLMKFNKEEEEAMINKEFIRLMMQEMISKESYTPEGIAYYTNTAIDLVIDIYRGDSNPSPQFLYRLIELHYTSHKERYLDVLKKLLKEYC